jgi:ATP-dependent Lhr-like helicase
MNATDPAQVWGKALEHMEGRSFINVAGTEVALMEGRPVALFERQGSVLRVFDEESLESAFSGLVKAFKADKIFSGRNRLVVKEYPACAKEALEQAGFMKEMQDYVLYRSPS